MPGPDGEDRFRSSAITTAADALLSMTGRDRVRLPERTLRLVGECFPVPSGVDSGKGAVVMSNTPRVFVGATTLLSVGRRVLDVTGEQNVQRARHKSGCRQHGVPRRV